MKTQTALIASMFVVLSAVACSTGGRSGIAGATCAASDDCRPGLFCVAHQCNVGDVATYPASPATSSESQTKAIAAPGSPSAMGAPTISAAVDRAIAYSGERVTLSAVATPGSAEAPVITWDLTSPSGTKQVGVASGATHGYVVQEVGVHTFTARANNSVGPAESSVTVEVRADDIPLALKLSAPYESHQNGVFTISSDGKTFTGRAEVSALDSEINMLGYGLLALRNPSGKSSLLFALPSFIGTGLVEQIEATSYLVDNASLTSQGTCAVGPGGTGSMSCYYYPTHLTLSPNQRFLGFVALKSAAVTSTNPLGNQGAWLGAGRVYLYDRQAAKLTVVSTDEGGATPVAYNGIAAANDGSSFITTQLWDDGGNSKGGALTLNINRRPVATFPSDNWIYAHPRFASDRFLVVRAHLDAYTGSTFNLDASEQDERPIRLYRSRKITNIVQDQDPVDAILVNGDNDIADSSYKPVPASVWGSGATRDADLAAFCNASTQKKLSYTATLDYDVSPDGRQVFVVEDNFAWNDCSIVWATPDTHLRRALVIDIETGARTDVLAAAGLSNLGAERATTPRFLADGRQVSFISEQNHADTQKVYVVNVDASFHNPRQVFGSDATIAPATTRSISASPIVQGCAAVDGQNASLLALLIALGYHVRRRR